MAENPETGASEATVLDPVPEAAPEGSSLTRRLLPYASAAGALFLVRIIVYALRKRNA